MNRRIGIILTLVAAMMLPAVGLAERFVFDFTCVIIDRGEDIDSEEGNTHVTLENSSDRNDFTLTISRYDGRTDTYRGLRLINYIDDSESMNAMSFTKDDKVVFGVASAYENLQGTVLEIIKDGPIYLYCNLSKGYEARFEKEFERLKRLCFGDNVPGKNKAAAAGSVSKTPTGDTQAKSVTKPAAPASQPMAGKSSRIEIAGLPAEVEQIELSELKLKAMRDLKGLTGLRYHTGARVDMQPLSLVELINHPLGLRSVNWADLTGEEGVYKTLVAENIGFEASYKYSIGKNYGLTTALTVKNKVPLDREVDFGSFKAVWVAYGTRRPLIYINYDVKTEQPSKYPSFSYWFRLGSEPPGSVFDKKKTKKLIKKSLEAFISELKSHGFKVERDKGLKNKYQYSKGRLSGSLWLYIDEYTPNYSDLYITICHAK